MFEKIRNYLFYKVYRLNLHSDLVAIKRWKKWRRFLPEGKKVLEVGPGGGFWTIELLLKENMVTAVDIDKSSLDRLRRKVEIFPIKNKRIRLVNTHIIDFQDTEKYDEIIMFEVLEHIKDDKRVIKILADLLKEGGRLLISTPSDSFIPFYGSSDENISKFEDGGHVRKGYSLESLKKLLGEVGLKVIYTDHCGGFFTQRGLGFSRWLSDILSSDLTFRSMVNLILYPLTYLDFFYPSYPSYVNFLIARRTKRK